HLNSSRQPRLECQTREITRISSWGHQIPPPAMLDLLLPSTLLPHLFLRLLLFQSRWASVSASSRQRLLPSQAQRRAPSRGSEAKVKIPLSRMSRTKPSLAHELYQRVSHQRCQTQ